MARIGQWAALLEGNEGYLALSYLLEISPGKVRAQAEKDLPKGLEGPYQEIVQKRKGGLPLQYAIGCWEFFGYNFRVDPRALIPRPETELLVERILEDGIEGQVVADLGTGTGAIALSLLAKGHPQAMIGTDSSGQALSLARENEEKIRQQDPAFPKKMVQWIQKSGPQALPHPVDVLVSNPPYIDPAQEKELQKELSYEPRQALYAGEPGQGGLAIYQEWIPAFPRFLNPGGRVYLEIGADQGKAVVELLQAAGFFPVDLFPDYAGLDRMVRAYLSEPRGVSHV